MNDVPESIGYLRVNAQAIAALADSSDEGTRPDMLRHNGEVNIFPIGLPGNAPYLIHGVDAEIDMYVTPEAQKCRLVDGWLLPADPLSDEQEVRLIAPLQSCFDKINWFWRARFKLENGLTWEVDFTGQPDTLHVLPAVSYKGNLQAIAPALPPVWVQEGTQIPEEARVGADLLLDTTTGDLYLIAEGD
jgi:hypothetical protein